VAIFAFAFPLSAPRSASKGVLFGIGTFAKGGEFNKRNANKIMRWRLGVQFVAVVVIAGFAWLRSRS
jgi:hypothetical protein